MPGSVTNKQQVLPVPAGTEVPAASITGTGDVGLDGTVAPYTFLLDKSDPSAVVPLKNLPQASVGTAALASVAASASSVTLVSANAARKGLVVVNDSTAALYIAYAASATTSSYTYYVPGSQNGVPYTWEAPRPLYTGAIAGVWSSATGAARVTEMA